MRRAFLLAGAMLCCPALAGGAVARVERSAAPLALRVRLLAPTVAAAEPGLALLRAELTAAGYLIEERPAPGPPGQIWLDHLREAGAFGAVVPDAAGARAAAVVLVFPVDGGPPRRHEVDLGPLAALGETARPRRLTALAVRVAEVLQAHTVQGAESATPFDADPLGPRSAPAAPGKTGAVPAVGASAAPADPGAAAPDPGDRPADASAADPSASVRQPGGSGEATAAVAPPGWLRLQAGVTTGRAVTGVGSAVGPWLALSARDRAGPIVQLSLAGPSFARALSAPAGSVRVWGTLALFELGYERATAGLLSGFVTASGGVQHIMTRGRPAPGFVGSSQTKLSPAFGVSLGIGLRLSPSLNALISVRMHRLFRPSEVWIDATQVTTAPRLLNATTAALQLTL